MNQHAVDNYDVDLYPEPERTSLAAIFGFILSLVGCCGGVTAILGVPLSIFGLITTGRSRGRVGGKGFAVAGLLIGLLNLAVYGGCFGVVSMGLKAGMTEFAGPAERMFTSLEADQFDGARANLLSPAADVSDAEMLAFREAYQSSLGSFQSMPDGWLEYFAMFAELGPIAQGASGQQNVFPIPATFDSGPALILIRFDPQTGPGVSSITIIDMNGDEYELPMPNGWDSAQPPADSADDAETDPDEGP